MCFLIGKAGWSVVFKGATDRCLRLFFYDSKVFSKEAHV